MKTLLFLLARYPAFGGIETVTTALANQLAERYRIVICAENAEHEDELLPMLDSRIVYHRLPHHALHFDADNQAAFGRILREEQVGVIIYQDSYYPNQYLAAYARRECGIPLIVAEHSSPNCGEISLRLAARACPAWNLYRRLKYALLTGYYVRQDKRRRSVLYALCDRYIVLSEALKRTFSEYSYTAETKKLRAIGNPVSFFVPAEQDNSKGHRVIFIGQFVALKGIFRLLRIWQKIEPLAPDWTLTLVGDGPERANVEQFIVQNRLLHVELTGFQRDVRPYCMSASILCLCSDFEGFPMVLPEAMCCGAIPVAFDSFPALRDIITDGEDGLAIPAYDEQAFADALLSLMRDDARRQRMSAAALRTSASFRIETVIRHWEKLIEEL